MHQCFTNDECTIASDLLKREARRHHSPVAAIPSQLHGAP
jgi:hypothetical protein